MKRILLGLLALILLGALLLWFLWGKPLYDTARQMTPDMVSESDLILVMEQRHRKAIDSVEPAARGKIYRLCEWSGDDIPDPYRQARQAFEAALVLIEQGVNDWVRKITA